MCQFIPFRVWCMIIPYCRVSTDTIGPYSNDLYQRLEIEDRNHQFSVSSFLTEPSTMDLKTAELGTISRTPVDDLSFQTLFYQCKSCLVYLTSLSKWESHLQRCLRGTATSDLNNFKESSSNRSNFRCSKDSKTDFGLREVTFIQPILILERVIANKKFGQEPENWGKDADAFVKKRVPKLKTKSWAASLNDEEIDEEAISKTEEVTDTEWGDHEVKPRRNNCKKIKISKKAKGEEGNNKPKWICTRKPDGSQKRVRNRLYLRDKVDVRSFRFPCHLCPGKFYLQQELDVHVNQIHYGNRKLTPCCICGKIFNRRDSINSHIRAHENAELLKDKYDLLRPWSPERLNDLYIPKPGSKGKHVTFMQPKCYFCLLPHSSYHSYITHIRVEHSDPPEAHRFACTFEECLESFTSIQALVDHAKAVHPHKYYGKQTYFKMLKATTTEKKLVTPRKAAKKRTLKASPKAPRRKTKSSPVQRVKISARKQRLRDEDTFKQEYYESSDCDSDKVFHKEVERKGGLSPQERKIKLESTHPQETEVSDESYSIKVEPTHGAVKLEETDSFGAANLERLFLDSYTD